MALGRFSSLIGIVATCIACGPSVSGPDTGAGTSGADDGSSSGADDEGTTVAHDSATSAATSSGSDSGTTMPLGPDPDYQRMCQDGDFVCQTWGCEATFPSGSCFKPCTQDAVGEIDDECDEPQRPYCTQIPDSDFGDYDCNVDAYVCTADPQNHC